MYESGSGYVTVRAKVAVEGEGGARARGARGKRSNGASGARRLAGWLANCGGCGGYGDGGGGVGDHLVGGRAAEGCACCRRAALGAARCPARS
jgi:hypothetical protein